MEKTKNIVILFFLTTQLLLAHIQLKEISGLSYKSSNKRNLHTSWFSNYCYYDCNGNYL